MKNKIFGFFKKIWHGFFFVVVGKIVPLYKKVPFFIWTLSAIFGIFIFGLFMGILHESDIYKNEEYQDLQEKNDRYLNLIEEYHEMSRLYYEQGDSVKFITNFDVPEKNPEDIAQAIDDIKKYRESILIEHGRILELRDQAGLYGDSQENDSNTR